MTATSLSTPAALETGVTAAFWNPAAPVRDASLAAGVQVVQTPEALKMGGVLVGADKALGAGWRVGLLYGRIDVRDLVRTTTSPSSEDGSIPVYEQLLGLRTSYRRGALAVGAMLEMHDARFDTERDGGLTLDAGFRLQLHRRITVAAASHFFPFDFSTTDGTDLYVGIEAVPVESAGIAGTSTLLALRYGTTYRASGDLEHTLAGGVLINRQVRVDFAATSESAYGERAWRLGLGLGVQIGRYVISVARGSGLNDIGATYRVGLDVDILR
ncbi:MAG: hypothetical protein JSW43_00140 [Gemmatimonadota bacterium]|nr:MAG: hypothetical protein JSW43_00140 [Gemmatimonadota bacterium]